MKKILVPTDFSVPAQWALDLATSIALRTNSIIVLMHIVEQPGQESFNAEGQIANEDNWEEKIFTLKLIEKSRIVLAALADEVHRQGAAVETVIRIGNTFHGIKTAILEQNADLVVMGTSGHSKIENFLIGSNTEKVIRFSKCPVLTVHQKPSGKDFKNVVYATSMSDDEGAFASIVKNTQETYNSSIHVVRINTPNNFRPDAESLKIMKQFAIKHNLKNYTLSIYNARTEDAGINEFAAGVDADLIAMATHGRTGFEHVLVGSIAEDVASQASRPVLTYVTPRLYDQN